MTSLTPKQITKQFTAHYQPIVDLNSGAVAVLTNHTAARMLRGIVALAAALRLRTVAEGVETGEEVFFLRAAGVDCGQGWFWSRAVSSREASRMLENGYSFARHRRTGSKEI